MLLPAMGVPWTFGSNPFFFRRVCVLKVLVPGHEKRLFEDSKQHWRRFGFLNVRLKVVLEIAGAFFVARPCRRRGHVQVHRSDRLLTR